MKSISDILFPRTRSLSETAGGDNFWARLLGNNTAVSGVSITPESSMREATVYACVRILSEQMANLPKDVLQRGTSRKSVIKHPVSYLFNTAPNPWQTPVEFVGMMQGHVGLRGNAYARIIPGERGASTELWPIHPDIVKVIRLDNMNLLYKVTPPNGREETYAQEEIFHLRGLTQDGMVGLSPITAQRDNIGLALAQQRYASKFFNNAVRPSGYITAPTAIKTVDAQVMQQTFMEAYSGGDNWAKPMIMGGGLEWKSLGMTNDEAQFLDSRKLSAQDICKIFGVPPHLVGELSRSTNNNIEQQSIDFVMYTLVSWCRRWEETIARDLIVDDEKFYIKFSLRGLLRGDSVARAAFYQNALTTGWMSPNEVRDLEDLDPYEGGDNYFMQGAMVTVDRIINPPEVPAPVVPDPQATKDKAEQMSQHIGELQGEVKFLNSKLVLSISEIGVRDQQIAEANERVAQTERDIAVKELAFAELAEDSSATSEQLAAASTELTSLKATLLERAAEVEAITAKSTQAEIELAAVRAELEAAKTEASNASARLFSAIGDNLLLLENAMSQMLKLEIEGAGKAIRGKKPVAALEQFYDRQRERMLVALGPIIGQRMKMTECEDVEILVDRHLAVSQADLLTSLAGENITESSSVYFLQWPARASQFLDKPKEQSNDPVEN